MTSSKKPKVLLIGWDGADWEHITPLLDKGQLPTLEGLIQQGVMGNLATLQPVLSPMLWNSVATCKHANKHGIYGFTEPDEANGVRPFSSLSRKTKALWNIFSQNDIRSNVINWWASHPAEKINGCVVSNLFNGVQFDPRKGWQISPGTIHPEKIERPFAKFKVFPNELTEQHVLPFIPRAAEIDQEEDPRLEMFLKLLTETATTHSIATAVMETQPWDFMAVYYTGIDHFAHGFMQYHPPQMPNTSDKDFEMYKEVMVGAYRFHDMMLERLLQLAGEDTTVVLCSDHGFHSGKYRPGATPREPAGPAVWHRRYGIVVMKGENIKKDERIYGASLIDIGPTLMSLFGLPLGEDMDGRPLLDAFENPPDIATIPSWDEVDGNHGVHADDTEMSSADSSELMKQFVALGYIDDPGDDREKQNVATDVECKYNLSSSLVWQEKYDEAITLLEEITRIAPWETRFIVQLADAYRRAGYLRQAERLIEDAFDLESTGVYMVLVIYGQVKIGLDDADAGIRWLRLAAKRGPRNPRIFVQIGELFISQRRWEDAERAFLKAVELHPETAVAWMGLSTVYLHLKQNDKAAEAALDAVSLLHRLPKAHYNLGVAMVRMGEFERAVLAFKTALLFAPKHRHLHRWLSIIYSNQLPDERLAKLHTTELHLLNFQIEEVSQDQQTRREQLFDLPEFESEQDRAKRLIKERPRPHDRHEKSGKTFVLVSGLPRSGTSLMMQMLVAGGMGAITDEIRVADEDNPKGYFEWEDIKKIRNQPELLDDDELSGKVLKTISMLLADMPKAHDYKVIFMMRPVAEIAASQEKMIERLGTEGGDMDRHELARGLRAHRHKALRWLKKAINMDFIEVSYPQLIDKPEEVIPAITEFLGDEFLSKPESMISAIDQSLYRQKDSAGDASEPGSMESQPKANS